MWDIRKREGGCVAVCVAAGTMGEAYIYAHITGREGYGGNGEECMRFCVVM